MARKHIIAGLGQSDKKGATGQINYKSYFAKFFQILQKPVDYAGQLRIENLQMRRKSESAKEWMCEEKPSRWLYLYQLEARRRDLMHINWSPQAGVLRESCQISHLDFIRPLNWTGSKTDKLDLLLTSTALSSTHNPVSIIIHSANQKWNQYYLLWALAPNFDVWLSNLFS